MAEDKKDFCYYVNPITWVKKIFSYLITFLLFLNQFFVFILLAIIAVLFILFGYDRYAARTYVKDMTSKFSSGSFANYSAYNSPLKQGNKNLSAELASFYAREKYQKKQEKEAQAEVVEAVSLQKEETTDQKKDTTIVDQQPIWKEEDTSSSTSIQAEVEKRLEDIKKSTKSRQK